MIKKSRNFPEKNNATLELNSPNYCTIILVNYENFFFHRYSDIWSLHILAIFGIFSTSP